MPLRDFADTIKDHLRDPEIARGLLQDALDDDDPRVFLRVLRDIAKANNFSKITREVGIGRQAAYTSLSENGNPGYLTVRAILRALDLDITVRAKTKRDEYSIPSMSIRPEVVTRLVRCRELALEKVQHGPGAVYEAIMDTALAGDFRIEGPIGASYLFFDELGEYLPIMYSLTFSDLETRSDEEIADGLIKYANQACAYSEERIVSDEPAAA